MAQIIFTIPDDKIDEIIDVLARKFGWIEGNKGAFVKSKIIKALKSWYNQQKFTDEVKKIAKTSDPDIT